MIFAQFKLCMPSVYLMSHELENTEKERVRVHSVTSKDWSDWSGQGTIINFTFTVCASWKVRRLQVIRVDLLHHQPSLLLCGILLSRWWFSISVNFYLQQVFFNVKPAILCEDKITAKLQIPRKNPFKHCQIIWLLTLTSLWRNRVTSWVWHSRVPLYVCSL